MNDRYVAKNPENPLEELLQMADLIGCPEETILSCYNIFLSNSSDNDAYNKCIGLLKLYREKYPPLLKSFKVMGIL